MSIEFEKYISCKICPNECGVNRLIGELGVCGSNAGYNISAICMHKGEEPVIGDETGICNVFFSRCNLECIYCQNHQISSRRGDVVSKTYTLEQVIENINKVLNEGGTKTIGFVSPTHYIPHVKAIVSALREKDNNLIFVYNTNAYDKVEELKQLECYIDIYLPDFKYIDATLALQYSNVKNYPQVACAAIKEMYRQKGSTLRMGENGLLESGLIIRHLVLPKHTENSIGVLNKLADISTDITISLMAQYNPSTLVEQHPLLDRKITPQEYEVVLEEWENLGFYKGWQQKLESSESYNPDFNKEKPF